MSNPIRKDMAYWKAKNEQSSPNKFIIPAAMAFGGSMIFGKDSRKTGDYLIDKSSSSKKEEVKNPYTLESFKPTGFIKELLMDKNPIEVFSDRISKARGLLKRFKYQQYQKSQVDKYHHVMRNWSKRKKKTSDTKKVKKVKRKILDHVYGEDHDIDV